MSAGLPGRLGAAFWGAAYGPADFRFRLAERGGVRPPWAVRGESWAIVTDAGPLLPALPGPPLREVLHATGHAFEEVTNGEGRWREAAYLILLRPREALALGRRYGQAAVLVGCGARAALLWHGGELQRGWVQPLD